MKNKLFKTFMIICLSFLAISCDSSDNNSKYDQYKSKIENIFSENNENTYDQAKSKCSACPQEHPHEIVPFGYNKDGRINVCSNYDIFLKGSYIYWNVHENHLDLAEDNFTDTSIVTRDTVKFDFDGKSGFKVGAGFGLKHDNWALYVDYTRIHGSVSRNYYASLNHTLVPHWIITNANNIISTNGNWKYEYDMFTVSLLKDYYTGQKLIFGQSIGFKSGMLDQSLNVDYISTITRTARPKSKSWLLGPRLMFNSDWILGKGFDIFGNLGICLLYQKFTKISTVQTDPSLSPSISNFKSNNISQVIPNIELMIGLKWGQYSQNKNYHFDLSVAYELQNYWTQNMMRNLISRNINVNSNLTGIEVNGNFMLHGLTLSARLDF